MEFQHHNQAVLDDRCWRLIRTLGFAGYGLYWGLVETLLQTNERSFPLDSIPRLASKLHVHSKTLRKLIVDFDLFEINAEEATFRSIPGKLYQETSDMEGAQNV